MIRWIVILLLSSMAATAETSVPSGLDITAYDVLEEEQPDGEHWLVLRYLAPAIADGAIQYDAVVGDLQHLCQSDGILAYQQADEGFGQIVVILMDRPVDRGEPTPDATQYIGAYLPENGECVWNDF